MDGRHTRFDDIPGVGKVTKTIYLSGSELRQVGVARVADVSPEHLVKDLHLFTRLGRQSLPISICLSGEVMNGTFGVRGLYGGVHTLGNNDKVVQLKRFSLDLSKDSIPIEDLV